MRSKNSADHPQESHILYDINDFSKSKESKGEPTEILAERKEESEKQEQIQPNSALLQGIIHYRLSIQTLKHQSC